MTGRLELNRTTTKKKRDTNWTANAICNVKEQRKKLRQRERGKKNTMERERGGDEGEGKFRSKRERERCTRMQLNKLIEFV